MPGEDEDALDERVIENVLTELRAQNALGDLGLEDEDLQRAAWAIAVNLGYAFHVHWRGGPDAAASS